MPSAPERTANACFGALALELTPGSGTATRTLPQLVAAELAERMAGDLGGFVAMAGALDLAVLGAHFDPAELLRPGWPLHRALAELAVRGPGRDGSGRILAFGSHEGRLPSALQPDAGFDGGPLRLVPFALSGGPDAIRAASAVLEQRLFETGMASAESALAAQSAFGARLEHARYLTLDDLCALTAVQYRHAGLAALWPLLESALLAPAQEAWLDAPPEPLARYASGEVRIAMLDIDAWSAAGFAPVDAGSDELPLAYERFMARQRQFAAILRAHGLDLVFEHVPGGRDPRQILAGSPDRH